MNPDFFSKAFPTKLVYSPALSSNEQGRKWEGKFGKLQTGNLETLMAGSLRVFPLFGSEISVSPVSPQTRFTEA